MEWLNSTWIAVSGYTAIAILTLSLGYVEVVQKRTGTSINVSPGFWFVTCGLLLAMALGQAIDAGDLLADLGRQRANSEGWYNARRSLQTGVVASVAAIWGIVVIVLWRVPEHRRRYLPAALAVFTLACFAGIRMISLHQVDALLYNRHLGGVTIRAVTELALLTLTMVVVSWQIRARVQPSRERNTD